VITAVTFFVVSDCMTESSLSCPSGIRVVRTCAYESHDWFANSAHVIFLEIS
jgi:hypothetical protein